MSEEVIGFGPQLLLDQAATTKKPSMANLKVCYYAFADDSGVSHADMYGEGGRVWRHNCFADLSCIKKQPVGTPAFMSLRIGLVDPPRECDDAFVKWLFDPALSPWREYADELMPTVPMLLNWKGEEVNIHSHEFRRDVGVVLLKHISRRVAINFLKVYRLLGEHTDFILVWYEMVQAGMGPTEAFWSAQFCIQKGAAQYSAPGYYDHTIFRYGSPEPDQLMDLLNMRDGRLERHLYENDISLLKGIARGDGNGFGGCDSIWSEKHPAACNIKFNGQVRNAIFERIKAPPKKVVSGGLSARLIDRREDFVATAPKGQVIEVFKTLIKELVG